MTLEFVSLQTYVPLENIKSKHMLTLKEKVCYVYAAYIQHLFPGLKNECNQISPHLNELLMEIYSAKADSLKDEADT